MQNFKFIETLPLNNNDDSILVLKSAQETFANDWFSYANNIIAIANNNESILKTFKYHFRGGNSILDIGTLAKTHLGVGGNFSVIDIQLINNSIQAVPLMDYEKLSNIYYAEKDKVVNSISVKSIIDKFFIYQWTKGKLLYPSTRMSPHFQRTKDWSIFVGDNEILYGFRDWTNKKTTTNMTSALKQRSILSLMLSTQWKTFDDIDDNQLSIIQKNLKEKGRGKRGSYYNSITVLNEFRRYLIDIGMENIRSSEDIRRENLGIEYDDEGRRMNRFAWIDLEEHPQLTYIKEQGDEFITSLENSGLSIVSINAYNKAVNHLVNYLIEYYAGEEITIELVNEIFSLSPPMNENLFTYLKRISTDSSSYGILYKIATFLFYAELLSVKAKKNIPKKKKNIKLHPYRNAMPREMVADLVDIIKNRPPNSTTKWDKSAVDTSWWKFDAYPVFPIMTLMMLFIPLRGEQIRNLCRANSFILNNKGQIETILVNTDKNVNRSYLQEIPCVWDDLQILVPFLNWHKEYYKNLPKVIYHDDPNSPWQKIEPLMTLPNTLKPMDRKTHFVYHKKVMCKYQLEKILEAKEKGSEEYPVVAWRKDKKPFFKTFEEIDKASANMMGKIEVMYDIHSFRVTGATRYLESGIGLKMVMELTGHQSANMLMQIYIRLTKEEKKLKLRSAVDKIFFGDKETLVQSGNDLIKGELTQAFNNGEEALLDTFEANGLRSIHTKSPFPATAGEYQLGTDIALLKHPSSWKSMIFGLCPCVKCPIGRENKCSMCPYLITGRLFIEGITHQSNRDLMDFQRLSIEMQEEELRGYSTHAKTEELETKLEEILGWRNVLDTVESKESESDREKSKELVDFKEQSSKLFGTEVIATDLAYLHHAYSANLMGVEKDQLGMKVLTIKAMKLAISQNDKETFDLVSSNENKMIDSLMSYYQKNNSLEDTSKEFVSSVLSLPKPK